MTTPTEMQAQKRKADSSRSASPKSKRYRADIARSSNNASGAEDTYPNGETHLLEGPDDIHTLPEQASLHQPFSRRLNLSSNNRNFPAWARTPIPHRTRSSKIEALERDLYVIIPSDVIAEHMVKFTFKGRRAYDSKRYNHAVWAVRDLLEARLLKKVDAFRENMTSLSLLKKIQGRHVPNPDLIDFKAAVEKHNVSKDGTLKVASDHMNFSAWRLQTTQNLQYFSVEDLESAAEVVLGFFPKIVNDLQDVESKLQDTEKRHIEAKAIHRSADDELHACYERHKIAESSIEELENQQDFALKTYNTQEYARLNGILQELKPLMKKKREVMQEVSSLNTLKQTEERLRHCGREQLEQLPGALTEIASTVAHYLSQIDSYKKSFTRKKADDQAHIEERSHLLPGNSINSDTNISNNETNSSGVAEIFQVHEGTPVEGTQSSDASHPDQGDSSDNSPLPHEAPVLNESSLASVTSYRLSDVRGSDLSDQSGFHNVNNNHETRSNSSGLDVGTPEAALTLSENALRSLPDPDEGPAKKRKAGKCRKNS
ncbi:MAG: hypothetical protein Q9227_009569 [Pyrenula ochraceoflavens]